LYNFIAHVDKVFRYKIPMKPPFCRVSPSLGALIICVTWSGRLAADGACG